MYEISGYLEQQGNEGDDSLIVFERMGVIWFCVSDGAGGTGGGKFASLYVVTAFEGLSETNEFCCPEDFETFLMQIDKDIARENNCGEATAVLGRIESNIITGASVGDSEAWIFNKDYEYQITSLQNRKPLLGSGAAKPIGFGPIVLESALLVGSDGLFKYSKFNLLQQQMAAFGNAEKMANVAKLSTGALQDDVSIIVVRKNA